MARSSRTIATLPKIMVSRRDSGVGRRGEDELDVRSLLLEFVDENDQCYEYADRNFRTPQPQSTVCFAERENLKFARTAIPT